MTVSLIEHLTAHRLVAILRGGAGTQPGLLVAAIDTLVDAGVRALEVTLPTPGALAAIREASRRYGDEVWVGAGTVLTADEVGQAASAGARFVVSPDTNAGVLAAAHDHGMGSLPGAATPTEILSAYRLGATAVKVFPARSLGGAEFVRDVLAPLPNVPLIAVGGVTLDSVEDYLAAGAVALGIGSPLIGDALAGGSLDALGERARALVASLS